MTLWYLARAAGFVALLTASTTVALGALGTSSWDGRRIMTHLVHRSAAVLTLAMLGLHAVLLVTDRYVDVGVGGALVPFTAHYRGVALGLGTLAVYGFAVVSLSGALRGRLATSTAAVRTWRGIHVTAYGAWGLAMLHGILAGTDTGLTWALALYAACGVLVAGAAAVRLNRLVRDRRRPLARARHRAAVPVSGGTR
ncbi:ferric reductase [Nocardioides sp. L-11A]|uniref:ferric reductase n=1 Tax=Nocardioides sp. L-11A TaxID=3043848 RepID=UPI00249BD79C|nr:ferric reductase [Nocardioides sp. L-11A]